MITRTDGSRPSTIDARYAPNPFTTVPRNVISGLIANMETHGTMRTLSGIASTVFGSMSQMTARQLGTVKASFLDALEYNDPDIDVHGWVRKFTGATLKYSGYNGSEEFVRTVSTASAMQWVTDFLAAAPNSSVAKEAEAMMARMKVDPAAVRAEKGDFAHGRESRTLIRRLVKEAQFGYDSSQVPVWANSATAPLWFVGTTNEVSPGRHAHDVLFLPEKIGRAHV